MNSQTRLQPDFFFHSSPTTELPYSSTNAETFQFEDQSSQFSKRQAQESSDIDSFSDASDVYTSNLDFGSTLQQGSSFNPESRTYVQSDAERRGSEYLIGLSIESQSHGVQIPQKRKSNICLSRENIMKQWASGDDAELMNLADQYKNDWKKIARRITSSRKKKVTPNFLKNRYKEIAGDHIKKGVKFTHEEDLEIARLFEIHGTSWTLIAHQFQDRTPVMIKNRYYSHIRRKGLLEHLVSEAQGKSKSPEPSEESHEVMESPSSDPHFQEIENHEPEYEEMIGNNSLEIDESYNDMIGDYPNPVNSRISYFDDEGLCYLQRIHFDDELRVRVTDRYPEHNFQ